MNQKSIRAWGIQNNIMFTALLYQTTTFGIFKISNVRATIITDLDPLQWFALSITNYMKKITRIELHAISGIHEDIIQETLDNLVGIGLLDYCKFDRSTMENNITVLKENLGNEWFVHRIKRIYNRPVIRQYILTEEGKKSLEIKKTSIDQMVNLDIIITGSPFHLFLEKVDFRAQEIEDIKIYRELPAQILQLVRQYNTNIYPKSTSSQTLTSGKELTGSIFWIGIQENTELLNSRKHIFLTSNALERWIQPKWEDKLNSSLPKNNLRELLVKAISDFYDMNMVVVDEGLKFEKIWALDSDLEMLMMISRKSPELIQEYYTEVSFKLPNSNWKISIELMLTPHSDYDGDTLALDALIAGRFHSLISKRGFTESEGYELWKKITNQLNENSGHKEYKETLDLLLNYGCITEKRKEYSLIVVDLDDILSFNKRERQNWQFSRIQQIQTLLARSNCKKIVYVYSDTLVNKVDRQEEIMQWLQENETYEYNEYENLHPAIEFAKSKNGYYLGNRNINGRIKKLNYTIEKNQIKIPKLEIFYEWRSNKIFDAMYKDYYE